MAKLTEFERGYLSAWLDTDGFLSIRREPNKKTRCGSTYCSVRGTIGFVNTNLDVLKYIRELIYKIIENGGHLVKDKIKKNNNGISSKKPVYRLAYGHKVIRQLLPFLELKNKNEQAKIMKELVFLKEWASRETQFWNTHKTLWARIQTRYDQLYQKMKMTNGKFAVRCLN